MQRPGKIKDVKKKIHAKTSEVLQHGVDNSIWTLSGGREGAGGSREKFNGDEESRKRNEFLQEKRAGGAPTSSLWLCYAKLSTEK